MKVKSIKKRPNLKKFLRNEDFFKLEAPVLESEDTDLFSGVLKSYGEPVVQAITLVNVCLPNLAAKVTETITD